jgi:hypothetical protein
VPALIPAPKLLPSPFLTPHLVPSVINCYCCYHHKGWPCHLQQCKQQSDNDERVCSTSEDRHRQGVQLGVEENQVCLIFAFSVLLLMNYSCLAHIVNLAMQCLILSYSKSLHFDPKQPEVHVPTTCDEVGLVRAIVVKVTVQTAICLLNIAQHYMLHRNICCQSIKGCGTQYK